ILSFIDSTVAANSDIASSYVYGKTYENRNLKAIVLKTPTTTRSIWIDCGIHAREWVSPASCVYLIDRFIREYRSGEPETVAIMNKYEIHITPLLNPDGYEYSQTTSRLWRKNRSPNQFSSCVGTDLNRNFPYRWLGKNWWK
ncbi:carboxypeptidase O, partial [Brachionus plicatilis]